MNTFSPSIPTGIATEYAGVRFRSRLEAKWAVFFDRQAWPWEYEPLDLDGYIPDFLVRLHRIIAVEVKPLMWDDSVRDAALIADAQRKLDRSGWDDEALLLGAAVSPTRLGMLRDAWAGWGDASTFKCHDCGRDSFLSGHGHYMCRVNGCYGTPHSIDMHGWDAAVDFRAASNTTQWRPS